MRFRLRTGLLRLCLPLLALAADLLAAPRYPLIQTDDETRFFKRTFPDERQESFFNYEGRPMTFVLGPTPLPLVDWALVETGHVGWMGEDGSVVPLSDEHGFTEETQILPVPFGVASGVEIRVQPPDRKAEFSDWMVPATPWEEGGVRVHTLCYDEEEKAYRLWYEAWGGVAYAESEDFRHWRGPMIEGADWKGHTKTNFLRIANEDESPDWIFQHLEEVAPTRFNTFFEDPSAPPEERFKTTFVASSDPAKLKALSEEWGKPLSPMVSPTSANCVYGAVSPDGVRWNILKHPILLHDADTRTVIHYDPSIRKYAAYTRLFEFGRRTIARSETEDFRKFPLPRTVIETGPGSRPYLDHYANACSFYPGHPSLRFIFDLVYDRSTDTSDIHLFLSRNGYLWHEVPGGPILRPADIEGKQAAFNHVLPTFVKTPEGEMIVVSNNYARPHKFPRHRFGGGMDEITVWKQDRLAALVAEERGEFTTPYLRLDGNRIQLNMKTERAGSIQVEVCDESFKKIPGRSFAECDPLFGDDVGRTVTWNGESDLSAFNDKLVYLRFRMRAAKLFAISAAK